MKEKFANKRIVPLSPEMDEWIAHIHEKAEKEKIHLNRFWRTVIFYFLAISVILSLPRWISLLDDLINFLLGR